MKVLYMSGYTQEAMRERGLLPSDPAFLPKPFAPALLSRRVREALDQPLL